MKITSLLSQYLFTHQRLDLPGIGSFFLEQSASLPVAGKNTPAPTEHIRFEYRADLKEPTDLVNYISEHSGKMKALASSDLESFIELAQQFLNIGKPFQLEGIGTLVRLKPGEFEFTPAIVTTNEKKRDSAPKENLKTPYKEDNASYDSFLNEPKPKEGWRKPVIALLIIAGLGLAIWGGYSMSKKSPKNQETITTQSAQAADEPELKNIVAGDSTIKVPESNATQQTIVANDVSPSGEYKYVLETAKRTRAFKRYNQLLTNLWKVKLETQDSLDFKLYLSLPKNYGDTTRIKDSLRVMLGKPVYIEQ